MLVSEPVVASSRRASASNVVGGVANNEHFGYASGSIREFSVIRLILGSDGKNDPRFGMLDENSKRARVSLLDRC